ncbi:SUN domain-containing protein 1 isoform X2 [Anolis carolinensis]|uniref:SUN domain-containing protein 1 isoform X2 n=1 Tax=Anolis carolinensis TaxID=28377 RepID=UPI002F2B65A4
MDRVGKEMEISSAPQNFFLYMVFKKINRKRHVFTTERAFEDRAMDSIPCCSRNLVDQRLLVPRNTTTYKAPPTPVIAPIWTTPRRRQRKTLWMGLIFLAFLFGISLRFILSTRLLADKEKGNTGETFLDPPVQGKTAPVRQENEGIKKNLEKTMAASLPQTPELDIPPDNTENIHANIRVGMCYIVQPNAYKEGSDDATKEGFPFKSLGALVVKTSKTFEPEALVCLMGCCRIYQRSPNVILQTDNSPGNCWAMDGSQGFLIIKLSQPSCPSFLLLDHLKKELAPTKEITSAPQNFSVYGFRNDFEMEEGTFLGSFIYNINDQPTQMFKLEGSCLEGWQYLKLVIASNWNNPNYTCIYEVGVYN